MAKVWPLLPPNRQPPRLAAELANFVRDLALRCAVLEGLGRAVEANVLRASALSGLANDDMHAMALRELAESGTISRELGEHGSRRAPIRDYTEEDLPAVCRIYLEAKPDELEFEAGPFTFTPLEDDAILMAAFKESEVIVYDADGVQGFAAVFEGQLRALFVQASARGQGVGKTLLEAALIGSSGALTLNVARSNLDAIRFYENNGFAIAGEVTRQYSGIEVRYAQMRHSP
jgi:putative acetyltransferase